MNSRCFRGTALGLGLVLVSAAPLLAQDTPSRFGPGHSESFLRMLLGGTRSTHSELSPDKSSLLMPADKIITVKLPKAIKLAELREGSCFVMQVEDPVAFRSKADPYPDDGTLFIATVVRAQMVTDRSGKSRRVVQITIARGETVEGKAFSCLLAPVASKEPVYDAEGEKQRQKDEQHRSTIGTSVVVGGFLAAPHGMLGALLASGAYLLTEKYQTVRNENREYVRQRERAMTYLVRDLPPATLNLQVIRPFRIPLDE